MRLVLYSGGQKASNQILHQELIRLTGKRRGISLTYIPFCSDESELFFKRAIRRYEKFGVSKFHCLDLDTSRPPSAASIKQAFQSDIIYLSGGNTFYFLRNLKKRRLIGRLRQYAREGGVIAGLSAGALMMTPNIKLAGLKGIDPDRNDVKLASFSSLNLVHFEFVPHFDELPRSILNLKKYSSQNKNLIYACADGGGIVIRDDRFSIYGKSWVFYDGEMFRLT